MSARSRAGILAVAAHLWNSPVHSAASEMLDSQPGETIVDIGSGFGAATFHLARTIRPAGHIVAVDPSRLMRTAQRARRTVHPDRDLIDVRPGTAERLPIADHSVDAIIAMNVAHLIRDVGAAATEAARVLRPAGRVLFVKEDIDHPDHRFHHAKPHAPDGPTMDDLARALEPVLPGLTIEKRRIGGQPTTIVAGRKAN